MPISSQCVVVALATLLVASACDDDKPAEQKLDAGLPDSGTYVGADGGAGSGGSGASSGGGAGGSSGRAAAANGGNGATSGSGGKISDAGSGGLSGTGGSGDPGAGCAKDLEGPALVKVPAPDDSAVSSYCVDATEVTNAQYAMFLSASVATTGQDEPCAWNTSYTPSKNWPAADKENHPVVSVDWCDAFAFCKWAGKHLCGKIGGGESHFSFGYDDAGESEWFNACSAGDTSTYANGDEYYGSACVGIDYNEPGYQQATDLPQPVGTQTCVGGYPGLHDLSGNVWEWENSCRGPNLNDGCHMRGGASNTETTSLKCDTAYDRERNYASSSLGFRCCSDAKDP